MSTLHQDIAALTPRLQRYARALLRGDVAAADDLVQDCLERAISRSHRWRRGTDLRAWLFTILHNLYVNQVRRQCRAPDTVPLGDTDPADAPDSGERHVIIDELDKAMQCLPADQQEILLLVTIEGLKYREVATILGIPEGTVMSRLSRARERLHQLLNGERRPGLRRVK